MSDEELLKDITKDELTKDELTNIELINNTIEKLKDIETTLQKIDDDDKRILIRYYEYLKQVKDKILSEDLKDLKDFTEKGGIIIEGVETVDEEHKKHSQKFINLLEILDNLNKIVIDISSSYKYRRDYLSQTVYYLKPNRETPEVSYTYTSLNVLKDNINKHYDKKIAEINPKVSIGGRKKPTKAKHHDMTMKDIKEMCKANKIKLSKVVEGKHIAYKKNELLIKLKRKKLL